MRKVYIILFIMLAATSATANVKVKPFALSEVRLLDSRFRENFKRDSTWIMSISVEQLTHSFLVASGAFSGKEGGYMTVKKLGGWESLDCELRGHTTGHLMSALAILYTQTGDEAVKAKGDSIVQVLGLAQQAYGKSGYLSAYPEGLIDRNIQGKSVWAPFYTLHKILQGLLDQYSLCQNEEALNLAKGMGDWAYGKLSPLNDATRRRMIRNEFGGFNEAMYNLYALTKDERYLTVARFFYHDDKIDPLKDGCLDLGTNHANTFIPKLLGEARNYELFGNEDSRRAAENLFYTLAYDHAFITGEMSDKEHLFDPTMPSKHLTGYDGENCCTYNLLKLADHVFSWTADVRVADYYERALYNHILGQQDPASSMVCYFTPLMTGAHRLYSTHDNSFWCCVGSGFENHVKYASSIYFHNADELYVNLFIPSKVNFDGTFITQQTAFPEENTIRFKVEGKEKEFNMMLRKPEWATSIMVKINGKRQSVKVKEGSYYISIKRKWKDGDAVELALGMKLQERPLIDNLSRCALTYGPIVMAGELMQVENPFSNPNEYNDYYTFDFKVPEELNKKTTYRNIEEFKANSPLNLTAPSGINVRPLYDCHHCRYVVFWNKQNQ